jgi:hypothetical protein
MRACLRRRPVALRPEQRPKNEWRHVLFIEAAPPGQMLLVTLFITKGQQALTPNGAAQVARWLH